MQKRSIARGVWTGVAAMLASMAFAAQAPAADNYLYVTNPASDDVTGFGVASDGTLAPLPSGPFGGPTGAGNGPNATVVTPDRRALYIADREGDEVRGFAISLVNGQLGAAHPKPVGDAPTQLATDAAGERLFVANFADDTVSIFTIGPELGMLSELTASPAAVTDEPQGLAVSPDGSTLYITSSALGEVAAYSIGANGALTELASSPWATGTKPGTLEFTPDGRFLYVTNLNDDTVSAYETADDGTLTELPGSPFATTGAALDMTITANGTRVYLPTDGDAILGFSIGADGALTELAGSPWASPGGPVSSAARSDGRFLYTGNFLADSVRGFGASATGALTELAGSPFPTGGDEAGEYGVALTPNQGPVASIKATATPASDTVTLNADASTDIGGSIASYRWNFGDGETATTSGTQIKHDYEPGTYTAFVLVTDTEGCANATLFTGQQVQCNGGTALDSATFTVGKNVFTPKLKLPKKQKQGKKKIVITGKAGANNAVSYVASGKVKAGKKTYKLQAVAKDVKAGKTKKFKLKPANAKAKKIAERLAKGKKATAKIKVRFTDNAGNKKSKKAKTKLVAKKKGKKK